jgi:hypothetical protein
MLERRHKEIPQAIRPCAIPDDDVGTRRTGAFDRVKAISVESKTLIVSRERSATCLRLWPNRASSIHRFSARRYGRGAPFLGSPISLVSGVLLTLAWDFTMLGRAGLSGSGNVDTRNTGVPEKGRESC